MFALRLLCAPGLGPFCPPSCRLGWPREPPPSTWPHLGLIGAVTTVCLCVISGEDLKVELPLLSLNSHYCYTKSRPSPGVDVGPKYPFPVHLVREKSKGLVYSQRRLARIRIPWDWLLHLEEDACGEAPGSLQVCCRDSPPCLGGSILKLLGRHRRACRWGAQEPCPRAEGGRFPLHIRPAPVPPLSLALFSPSSREGARAGGSKRESRLCFSC